MKTSLLAALIAAASALMTCSAVQAQTAKALPRARASFVPIELAGHIGGLEPVLAVSVGQETKVYPLRILALHGVINDMVARAPLALSYCGPCGTVGAFERPADLELSALFSADTPSMTLTSSTGQWSQKTGERLRGSGGPQLLSAVPSQVVSMARVRQSAKADEVVLVLQDTDVSRVPTPKTLALPGGSSDLEDEDSHVAAANETKVLDARSWSLDLLSPERRLGDEDRLILLENKSKPLSGPPAP